MPKTLYLAKASDKPLSHCACPAGQALITAPDQLDCPWCGCGWLFSCIRCRRAFTVARVVETGLSLAELAESDMRGAGREVDRESLAEWVEYMSEFLAGIEPGKEYVFLDCVLVPTASELPLRFRGAHATHDLSFIPQLSADGAIVESVLGSRKYWDERRHDRQ